jgi:TonB family protein
MVSVALWINERGSVEQARVSESSGSVALDEIALALFQDVATFAPARSGRSPVPVQVTISVPFVVPW